MVKDIENDFRYIYRNRESYNRDISSENAIGMNDFDYYPPEMAQQKRKEDMEIAATGKGMHWIMEGKDKNGNLLILDKQKSWWSWRDSNPRPNEEIISFLHAYLCLSFSCRSRTKAINSCLIL